jgi:PPOX class probable F420-dependent enzyme
MSLDFSSDFGKRVAQRLRDETVVWLTTVRPDGTPEPSPVWFYWDGQSALIYSRPNNVKLANLQRDSRVSLNFDSDGNGGNIVVLTGDARIDPSAPPNDQMPEYLAKYRQLIGQIGFNPATFAQAYSVAIRVTPTKMRGF